ncbi:MAG: amino acid adenylation domain-containing protein, partial [Actinobacteria bacterium]|nr:amino acid adenylation domain-containing protein [Actinomycetota bacterium]
VETVAPRRDLAHHPLFQVSFTMLTPALEGSAFSGLHVEPLPVHPGGARFDLDLAVGELPDERLSARLEYDTDLFDDATVAAFANRYRCLLEAAVAAPDTPLSRLPLERGRTGLSARYPAPPPATALHRWFEAVAAERGRQPAVVDHAGTVLTYAELDARANRVAHRLRHCGVRRDAVVALCLPRSVDALVGILAVLKAGGVWLSIDPDDPPARRSLLAEDSGAVLVLTELPEGSDEDGPPDGDVHPENLAYLFYTSGSTGRPKAVAVSHRAVVGFMRAFAERLGLDDGTVGLAALKPTFDVSVVNLLLPLLVGGTVVLPPPGAEIDGRELRRLLDEHRCTTVHLTPSVWQLVLDAGWEGSDRLAAVCGGEPALPSLWSALAARAGSAWNAYGPTEATIWATVAQVDDPDAVDLGEPLGNGTVHVLDDRLEPAPDGVVGELCIGGVGLARGYLGRPGLTAERFVPDPFGPPGSRLYRTGDRVRRRHDGSLRFLGRVDHQVKVRGQRVELGEIETVLEAHPRVGRAVVATPDRRRLVAYTVGTATATELRAWVAAHLPAAMAPSAFVAVEAFPLTASGKVDRARLPDPGRERPELSAPYTPPRDAVEEVVAAVFAELLGLDRVGAHDDFFELGGHSLLAAQVVARVSEAVGADVPLRALFESPSPAGLAAASGVADSRVRPPLAPVGGDGERPASFGQERLWLVERLHPGRSAYNVAVGLRLAGPLDPEALAGAWDDVVARHEPLRTALAPGDDGVLRQRVLPAGAPLEVRHGPLDEAEAAHPFDIEAGPPARAVLFREGPSDHALLVVAHHSAVDGWSLGVLFRELAARYDARAAGGPAPPPSPAPAPAHGDWAAWQRSWLQGDVLEAEVSWWRSRLAGAPEVLELPTDRPRPAVPRHRGALHRFELDAALVARLEALARERRATLFMVLLAAFDVLVARHAGVDDVVVGTMVADRTHPDLEGLVGFFANTVALRTDCSGDPTFAELVARVRADALDAYAHQDVPFQHVVETVAPRRDLAHHPLFQVALLLQRQGLDGVAMSGLAVDRLDVAGRGSPLDLMLSLEDAAGGGLRAELEYDVDLFDEATVAALAERFRGLVQAVVEDPHRPVSGLPLLTEAERAAVAAGNATDAPYPDATLHRLFAERVATRPDGLAVIDAGGVTMTYGELDAASDRLAHHLRRRGVGADSVVALCLPRSIDYVVAVLAVAKAGGAWVAVDPAYPDERRRFMIEDSGAVVVLDALPPEESGAGLPAGPPDDVACPDNLAYLVYTSGSTGAPKGVSATHRSCVARQAWYAAELPWQPDEVACIKTSPSFVDAVGELWAPLLAGVPVLVLPEDVPPDGARLVDVLADHHVTRIILVPSLLAALLEQPPERLARLARLTLWVASGEPLPASTAAAFAARLPGATLVNLYGMSEVGPDATACVAPGDRDEPPPIGRPLHNVQVHVLDGRRAPVPPGVTGELYIGGVGLARGYHRRPGLTAERFVPDPFGPPGSRLYRTGDLVRRRPDGLLAFVGRADHQIKLRGHRVEPAEIEAVLERHPGVEAAVVAPRGERLVAYVAGAVDVPDLRAHASARLPAFLAPSAFVRVEEWPRLPNGKVDRAALPDPQPPSEQRPAGGGSPLEELVAATFADVLGLERVGVGDDFFELGGHSLLASRLVTRLAASLGRDVPLRALFEAPSPGGLAAALAHEGTAEDALPLVPVGRHADPPASFGQQRLWFLDRLDPGRPAYNVPVAVRLDGPLDVEALAAAWDDVVGRHEPLRTALHEADDGTLVQRVGASGAHLAVDPPGDAAEDARLPFDLAAGPLVRAAVRRTEDGAHVLSVVAHHAVVDGWSLRLVFEELALRYRARLAGDDRPPAPPAVQHADWAAWQRRRSFDAHTAWWREHLAGAPEVLQLPSDRPRPAVQGGCGAVVRTTVGPDVVAGIERLARTEQATLFVVLLAALDCVLARQSGCEDVVVGTVVANRGHPALDELVGFFANTVAVRIDCAGDPSFRDLVARARVAALGAFAHQDVPFERVVDAVAARRDLAHHPVFQVALVLQNTGEADVDLPGLAVTWLRVHPGTSRFDVSVVAWPTGGGLELELEYDTDLFDERSVAALGERLARVLAAVTADPAVRLSELPLLDRAEHRRLAASWESVAEPVPPPFPRLFEAVAAARPQAPAVVDADDSVLTYADLDARANGVAHWLRARGVGAEAVVALAL